MPLELRLEGLPPSKKNSLISIVNKSTGRPMVFPSSDYKKWEKAAAAFLRLQANSAKITGTVPPCTVDIIYQITNKRKWDLSNKTESVMDALVVAGILEDDNRMCVQDLRMRWFDSVQDGVKISLTY